MGGRSTQLRSRRKKIKVNPGSLRPGIISDLAACKAAFDQTGIPWVITDGIVLGYIRNGEVLAWDTDLDLGIFREITAAEWNKLAAALRVAKFGIRRTKQDFIYGRRRVKFNLWLFHPKGELCEAFPRSTKGFKFVDEMRWFREPRHVKFLGSTYPIPNHTEEYLDTHYGTDWRTRVVKDHKAWFAEKRRRAQKGGDLWPKMLKLNENP